MSYLSEYIKVLDNFQYAINIGYDLYSDDKIKNYIPTASAIDIIEEIMLSTSDSSSDRARIFTGPYGKGKSHLALVLLALLCRDDEELYSNILSVICQTRPQLCEYIKNYHKSGKKMLPVVIQGSGMGIRQAFLYGLKNALDGAELVDFMPETYFVSAVNAIKNWKENYPNTYEAFKNNISGSVSEFINELSAYNNEFYNKFTEIYPSLTSGSEFNPIKGLDIVDLYRDVVSKISNYGYNGIFVVFDEFSKQLEGNMNRISGDEIKALQDFAEYCNRSQSKQIHLLLISHKSILNYVDDLSKADIDAWKAVSNRFKAIELNTTMVQTYDLMSKVMDCDNNWKRTFISKHKAAFNNTYSHWRNENIFSDINDDDFNKICYDCYPLAPITSFILPKISEEIAQNERTLFTFLSSDNHRNTLPKYLEETSAETYDLITPDIIFDYFEVLFKGEAYDKPTHKFWKLASAAIEKIDSKDSLKIAIVKTIALIYIVNRLDILPPSSEIITNIYNYGTIKRPQVIKALTDLEQSGIIVQLENKNQLKIAEQSGVNIPVLIENETGKIKNTINIETILNDYVGHKVLYPNAYNDENSVVRYFDFRFILSDNLVSNDWNNTSISGEDGIIYAVIEGKTSIDIAVEKISQIDNRQFIFIVPTNTSINVDFIYRHYAINKYIEKCEDTILVEELSYSISAWEEYIDMLIDGYLKPEIGKSVYYNNRERINIRRKTDLSTLLSEICTDIYYHMPIINNEMINKNNISAPAANSRNKIIDGLLQNTLQENLGFIGNGQETSIMRSTLKITGVLDTNDDVTILNTNNCLNENLNYVFEVIRQFILDTSNAGPRSFEVLYNLLTASEHHIGMKKGLIPIYIACVLRNYKKYAVITKGKREIEITSRLIESINDKPEDYSIYIESWDGEKETYINTLEQLFSVYVRKTESEYSNFDYIVKAIQRWFLQLPKYSIQARRVYDQNNELIQIDRETINFINSFKVNEINARELLFEKVFKIFGYNGFDLGVLEKIEKAKSIFDNAKTNLINYLALQLKSYFGNKNDKLEKSLYSVMLDWYENLNDSAKQHMYNGIENSILNTIQNVSHDEELFVENLARVVTELRIDDWAELTISGFVTSIEEFIKSVSECENISEKNDGAGVYKLTFVNDEGVETVKTFDKTDYSGMADLMYSDVEAMISEYGDAISKNEKRQILIDIINNLLG